MSVTFKLLSLNVRGIRSLDKCKAVFAWLMKQQADFASCKEHIDSTKEIENSWKIQWKGDMFFFFSHGSEHSRGVPIHQLHLLLKPNEKIYPSLLKFLRLN